MLVQAKLQDWQLNQEAAGQQTGGGGGGNRRSRWDRTAPLQGKRRKVSPCLLKNKYFPLMEVILINLKRELPNTNFKNIFISVYLLSKSWRKIAYLVLTSVANKNGSTDHTELNC